MRTVMAAVLVVLLAGCSWFRHKPPASPDGGMDLSGVEPIAAARAACPGYDELVRETRFPRDAIIRGLASGKASVVFAVDGTRVTVLSVTSSNPVFGGAAEDAVRTLRCTVDRPARFAIAFDWPAAR